MSTTTQDEDLDDTMTITDGEGDDGTPNPDGEDRGDIVAADKPLDPKAVQRLAAEADAEDDGAAEGKTGKPMPSMIPKARFDEVNDTAKELRRQNELLMQALAGQGKLPASAAPAPAAEAEPVDVDKLEADYVTALLDGNTEEALKLRRTINAELRRQATDDAVEVQTKQTEAQAFAAEVQAIYADYPELDNKGTKADAAAIAEVVEWRDFLVDRKGLPYHTALRQAADRVAAARGWDKADGDEPKPTNTRTEEQRRRNAQANLDQPPIMDGGVGNRAGRARQTNVATMTDAEFQALPEAEKKRLRGD